MLLGSPEKRRTWQRAHSSLIRIARATPGIPGIVISEIRRCGSCVRAATRASKGSVKGIASKPHELKDLSQRSCDDGLIVDYKDPPYGRNFPTFWSVLAKGVSHLIAPGSVGDLSLAYWTLKRQTITPYCVPRHEGPSRDLHHQHKRFSR